MMKLARHAHWGRGRISGLLLLAGALLAGDKTPRPDAYQVRATVTLSQDHKTIITKASQKYIWGHLLFGNGDDFIDLIGDKPTWPGNKGDGKGADLAFEPVSVLKTRLALARLRRALGEVVVEGIKTNVDLHKRVIDHPDFIAGKFDTHFLERL